MNIRVSYRVLLTIVVISGALLSLLLSHSVLADTQKVIVTKAPLVIETQVKGSQEQPNVIYILPWQNIKSPIKVDGGKQTIILPNFEPVNPKKFKQHVSRFYQQKK